MQKPIIQVLTSLWIENLGTGKSAPEKFKDLLSALLNEGAAAFYPLMSESDLREFEALVRIDKMREWDVETVAQAVARLSLLLIVLDNKTQQKQVKRNNILGYLFKGWQS